MSPASLLHVSLGVALRTIGLSRCFFVWFAERASGHAAAVRLRTGAAWVARLACGKFMAKPTFVAFTADSSMRARTSGAASVDSLHCLHPTVPASNVAPNNSFNPMPLRGTG